MWATHSGEQISEGDLTCIAQYSCTTACNSTAALLQTSILTLFERTWLFRWAWAVTEQNDRAEYWTEHHAAHWWRLRERGKLNTTGRCGINIQLLKIQCIRQNASSRHIICLDYFLYSSYSRNRFSPKKVTRILFPNVILTYCILHTCVLIWLICSTIGQCQLIKRSIGQPLIITFIISILPISSCT